MKEVNRGKIISIDDEIITVKFYDCTERKFLKSNFINEINKEDDVVLYNNGTLKIVPIRIKKVNAKKMLIALLIFIIIFLISIFFIGIYVKNAGDNTTEYAGTYMYLCVGIIVLLIEYINEVKYSKKSINGIYYYDKFDPNLKEKKQKIKKRNNIIKNIAIIIGIIPTFLAVDVCFFIIGCLVGCS